MLKRNIILTAMIFWACVLIINLLRPPVSDINSMKDAFLSEKIFWKNRFDLVVTGDSRTLLGISPKAMHDFLPHYKIGNLGYIALVYSQDYMNYVKNSLHPPYRDRVIVIGFSPRSLLKNKKSECQFHMLDETRLIDRIESDSLSKWLYLLFHELSEDDLDNRFNEGRSRRFMISFESGWIAARFFPEKARGSKEKYKNHFLNNKIDSELLDLIFRNTRTWTQEGIKVFGTRIPMAPNIYVIEKEMSGFNESSVRQSFEKNGGIWLNPEIGNLIAYDGSHLRYDSAIFYSRSLANELRKYLNVQR